MKRIFSIMLLLTLLLTACGAPGQTEPTENEKTPAEESASEPGASVHLETEHEVYDPSVTGYTYFITNGTGEILEFGEPYGLQRWENGQWQDLTMKSNSGFNAIGYALQPGGSMALTFGFGLFKENPRAGFYRLVKPIGDETYYAEFELGESIYTDETPYGFATLEDLSPDYSAETASEMDVVFTAGGVTNDGVVEEFLHKVGLGVDCQLRTVQDQNESAVMVIDVIYENDYFLWRMWSEGYVTEKRFSYIVTDGEAIYLSNGADWQSTQTYDSDKVFLVPEGTLEWLIPKVEEMTANRLEGSSTRYKIWSEDNGEGVWSVGLPEDEPTGFFAEWHSAGGGGRGSSYDLQNWDGLETTIREIEWQEDRVLQLTCDTAAGETSVLYFDAESETLETSE